MISSKEKPKLTSYTYAIHTNQPRADASNRVCHSIRKGTTAQRTNKPRKTEVQLVTRVLLQRGDAQTWSFGLIFKFSTG